MTTLVKQPNGQILLTRTGLPDVYIYPTTFVTGVINNPDKILIRNNNDGWEIYYSDVTLPVTGSRDLLVAELGTNFFFDPSASAGGSNVTVTNNPLPTLPTLNLDAFERHRVSNTDRRIDIEFKYDLQPELFKQTLNGAASVTFDSASRDVRLKVNNTGNGALAEHICKFDAPYTAGNSQLIEITGTADASGVNTLSAFVYLRSAIAGATVEIPQANWNKDTSPESDWSKSHIFAMDFQSLKVGTIRFAINTKGNIKVLHEIDNDNIRANGYWQDPNQPPVWRIYNTPTETITEIGYDDGVNGIGFRFKQPLNASAEAIAICCAVKSEGGGNLYDIEGIPNSCSLGQTARTVGATPIPILSIRAKTLFKGLINKVLIIPKELDYQANNDVNVYIVAGGTLTGASWLDVDATSAAEYDRSATAITGGKAIQPSYLATGGKNKTSGIGSFLGKAIISAARGTSDIVSIVAIRTTGTSADVFAGMDITEIQ